jgi:thiamine-phosphate pyrophosphorylase
VSLPNNSPLAPGLPPNKRLILCYVTDRRSLQCAPPKDSSELLLEKIQLAAAAGLDWIQLREKDLSGKQTSALTREALRRVSAHSSQAPAPARIIINDRLDVALTERTGGVHLGENSLPVQDARRLVAASQSAQTLPFDFLLGVSCHSLEAAQSAAAAGADYIFFGPVFATPSKIGYGSPQGLARLAEVCTSIKIPVLAIGGITTENAPSCLSAGASGIAAIRLFQDSPNLAATVNDLRQHFQSRPRVSLLE